MSATDSSMRTEEQVPLNSLTQTFHWQEMQSHCNISLFYEQDSLTSSQTRCAYHNDSHGDIGRQHSAMLLELCTQEAGHNGSASQTSRCWR